MNYTPIPDDFLQEMSALTDEEYGRYIRWLQAYRITGAGDVEALRGNERFYSTRGKMQIDRYVNRYNEQVEKRREAGRKGGLARGKSERQRRAEDRLNTVCPEPSAEDGLNTAHPDPAAEDGLNTTLPSNARQSQATLSKSSQTKTKTKTKTKTNTNLSIPLPPSLDDGAQEGQRWDGWMDYAKATEYFEQRFDLPHAEDRYGEHAEAVKGMAALLAEVVSDPSPTVRVSSRAVPKERFLQLTGEHAGYVAECMAAQTGEIRNRRSYLLTALYRAPETFGTYSRPGTLNTAARDPEQAARQTEWIQNFLAEYGRGAADG